ncbi:MAG: hypothetical protein AMXMBFR13_16880 [Phycisphaerae bacterium]
MSDRHDDIFKALADSSRRRIISALCAGPKVAGDLARSVGLAPNAVSFHLKWLKSAGLVSLHREGRFLRYRVEPEPLAAWQSDVRRLFEVQVVQFSPVPVRDTPARRSLPHPSPNGSPAQSEARAPAPGEESAALPTELL